MAVKMPCGGADGEGGAAADGERGGLVDGEGEGLGGVGAATRWWR